MRNRVRILVAAMFAAALIPVVAQQATSDFPNKPVRWVVPYPPGGTTDVIARVLGTEMRKDLPQPVVVDNRPGAGTNIAAEGVSRAAPDGYTVMSADNATLAYNMFVYPQLSYDPNKSLAPVGMIGRFPMALAVHPSVPVTNAKEFVAYAKANPDKIFYGSPGVGSPHHLNMEFVADSLGIVLRHVPYKGGAPAINALVSGEIHAMMMDLPLGGEFVKAGRVKLLALAAAQRAPSHPDLATFPEAGLPKMELSAWQGVLAPAGTPPAVIARLNASLNAALGSQAFRERFAPFAFEIMPGTPQALKAFAQAEQDRWGPFIRRKNISITSN